MAFRIIIFLAGCVIIFSCSDNPKNPDRFLNYIWSGAVTDTSAVIAFKINKKAKVRVVLSKDRYFNQDLIYSEEINVKESNYLTAKVTIHGLLPQTVYLYHLEIDGEKERDPELRGSFKTFSDHPFSYKIALASCARTGSASEIFNTIRKQNPLFYMNMGDLHYENISDNCEYNFSKGFFDIQRSPSQSHLYKNIPFVYMWDDHDYGSNNSTEKAPCRKQAVAAYNRFVPHYPLAFNRNNGPVSQTFVVGRVRFLLTDLRSQKVRPEYNGCKKTKEGTNFGMEDHLTWFKEQLLTAKKDSMIVAWISGIPWINDKKSLDYNCNEKDDWGGYAEERRHIADFIKEHNIPIFILSGDAHMVAIDDGSNSDYATGEGAPIPIFHAAPLDNSGSYKGGPYSHGSSSENGQFGTMAVIDEGGKQICIEWKGLNKYGEIIINQTGNEMKYRFCMDLW